MKKITATILAAVLLLGTLSACGDSTAAVTKNNPTEISVWYTDDGSAMYENLAGAVETYNSGDGAAAGISAKLSRSFDSDEALMTAVAKAGSKLPDLVICGRDAAMSLSRLGAATATDKYKSSFENLGIPAAYMNASTMDEKLVSVTLAVSVPMIILNTELSSNVDEAADLSNMEGLCAAAAGYENSTGLHFFTVYSFSELFRLALAELETDFYANREKDISNSQYVYLYNLLAVAAYDGGLTAATGSVAGLVAQGEFACGLTTSVDIMQNIADEDAGSYTLMPWPVVSSGTLLYSLDFVQLSITARDEGKQQAAAKFMKWLVEKSYDIAGESGYFSSLSDLSGSYVNGKTPSSQLLSEIGDTVRKTAKRRSLYVPTAQADYFNEGLSFEKSFRETLKGLN